MFRNIQRCSGNIIGTRIQKLRLGTVAVSDTDCMHSELFRGKDITDDMKLKIALQNYHYTNFDEFLGVPLEEVKKNMRPRVVVTSIQNIIEEYFSTHDGLDAHVEGRIELVE